MTATLMAAAANLIVFKVKPQDQEGEPLFFKMRTTTQFRSMFTEYCCVRDKPLHFYTFIYDGRKLKENDTPASVGMETELANANDNPDEDSEGIIVDAIHEGTSG